MIHPSEYTFNKPYRELVIRNQDNVFKSPERTFLARQSRTGTTAPNNYRPITVITRRSMW